MSIVIRLCFCTSTLYVDKVRTVSSIVFSTPQYVEDVYHVVHTVCTLTYGLRNDKKEVKNIMTCLSI